MTKKPTNRRVRVGVGAIIVVALVCMIPIWLHIYSISWPGEQGVASIDHNIMSLPPIKNAKCTCVDCDEDPICGGLWKGTNYPMRQSNIHNLDIHIIVSHCKDDLGWISKFTEGYIISSISVMSKCGVPVHTAPQNAKIFEHPNVGRCDHSYAKYITTFLDSIVYDIDKPSIVLFLKDSMERGDPSAQHGKRNTFEGTSFS